MKARKTNLIVKIKNKDAFDEVIDRVKKAIDDLHNFEFDIDVQKESVGTNDAETIKEETLNCFNKDIEVIQIPYRITFPKQTLD